MKKIILLLFIIPTILTSQNTEILLYDNNHKAINEYQIFLYYPKSTEVLYSTDSNKIVLNNNHIKDLDSVYIHYDGFYSQKLKTSELEKNSIILDKSLELAEVLISNNTKVYTLGVKEKKRKIKSQSRSNTQKNILQIEASDYSGAKIKNINLFLTREFRGFYGNKHTNKNKNIEFLLFQSNSEDPNEELESLLKNKIILNTENSKKGWLSVNLEKHNIYLKDYKFLYIGFTNLSGVIGLGVIKKTKLDNPPNYFTSNYYTINKVWREGISKNHKYESVPAFYIEISK